MSISIFNENKLIRFESVNKEESALLIESFKSDALSLFSKLPHSTSNIFEYFSSKELDDNDKCWLSFFLKNSPLFKERMIEHVDKNDIKNLKLKKIIQEVLNITPKKNINEKRSSSFTFSDSVFIQKTFYKNIFTLIDLLTAPLPLDSNRTLNRQKILAEIKLRLDKAIDEGTLANVFNEVKNRCTILHLAVQSNQIDLVKLVLKYDPPKEKLAFIKGMTTNLLGVAIWSGSIEMMELIIDYLKDDIEIYLNPKDVDTVSPILLAFFLGELNLFEFLFNKGALLEEIDKEILNNNSSLSYLKVVYKNIEFTKLYPEIAISLIENLNKSKHIDEVEEILKPLINLLQQAFLNSPLSDVRDFTLSFFDENFIEKIQNNEIRKAVTEKIYQTCGGMFTWGSVIARHQDVASQSDISYRYSNNQDINFVHQQINFGKTNFYTVYELAKNKVYDFDAIFEQLVLANFKHYEKIQHPRAIDFKSSRSKHFSCSNICSGNKLSEIKTPLGNGYDSHITYFKWIQQAKKLLTDQLTDRENQTTIQLFDYTEKEVFLTGVGFELENTNDEMIIKYMLYHTKAKYLKDIYEYLKENYEELRTNEELIETFI